MCAYFIGNRFINNIYDVIIDSSSAPYLQQLPLELYAVPVSEIMELARESQLLTLKSTYKDAKFLLETYPDIQVFSVVSSIQSMNLIGDVLREDIRRSLRRFEVCIENYKRNLQSYQSISESNELEEVKTSGQTSNFVNH